MTFYLAPPEMSVQIKIGADPDAYVLPRVYILYVYTESCDCSIQLDPTNMALQI